MSQIDAATLDMLVRATPPDQLALLQQYQMQLEAQMLADAAGFTQATPMMAPLSPAPTEGSMASPALLPTVEKLPPAHYSTHGATMIMPRKVATVKDRGNDSVLSSLMSKLHIGSRQGEEKDSRKMKPATTVAVTNPAQTKPSKASMGGSATAPVAAVGKRDGMKRYTPPASHRAKRFEKPTTNSLALASAGSLGKKKTEASAGKTKDQPAVDGQTKGKESERDDAPADAPGADSSSAAVGRERMLALLRRLQMHVDQTTKVQESEPTSDKASDKSVASLSTAEPASDADAVAPAQASIG
ncbi:hypothetical protein THASP1DRAFT_27575 [Thamnocephalis sphaerospora]|uniref:Uncharacterized protein n=1 Tax=Thamnocephalis sphaerospora TaxID=78915 RepID=A0A4V1IXD2_9FUNG|nr:hypothetical protein THASP1DRAFT_27575 [Thamnocephalis sphaerospora]|eukprot:RKP10649.1 hypothetical protein THASP1DRAFT_27575 [Thamnocephalis sphaerospora]